MNESPTPHVRRKRYRGTHPRKFEEKYKEHNPDKFAADIDKVLARGQTPAGMHRSICVDEILAVLNPQPGETALDATLGFGGHAQALLARLTPGGRLFATDVDAIELPRTEARLRAAGFSADEFIAREMNFSEIASLLPEAPGGFDCILADLGVSSMQLDNPARGFSYKHDGPLDLRLNPLGGVPASSLLQSLSATELSALLTNNADEIHAARIAEAVGRCKLPITTTRQLSELIRAALKDFPDERKLKRTLARTFMALRIAVNDEFAVLDRFLAALPGCMKPEARVAVLTFHSGEDRRVEQAFNVGVQAGLYSSVATEAIRPSPEEQRSNPRSAPARLRWAIHSGGAASDT